MKNKFIIAVVICMGAILQINAQTYYYTKEAIVRNGNKSSATGDGHFLTFNQQGLYESDGSGCSMGCGFVRYAGTDANGRRCYEGDGYLGHSLVYRISSDFSRINVTLPDNTIAVYVKASYGSGQERVYSSQSQYVVPDIPMPDITPPNNNNSEQVTTVTCPGCGGHGYIPGVTPSVSHFGVDTKTPDYRICPKCGHRYNANDGHTDVKCKVCNGTGVIKKRIR